MPLTEASRVVLLSRRLLLRTLPDLYALPGRFAFSESIRASIAAATRPYTDITHSSSGRSSSSSEDEEDCAAALSSYTAVIALSRQRALVPCSQNRVANAAVSQQAVD